MAHSYPQAGVQSHSWEGWSGCPDSQQRCRGELAAVRGGHLWVELHRRWWDKHREAEDNRSPGQARPYSSPSQSRR